MVSWLRIAAFATVAAVAAVLSHEQMIAFVMTYSIAHNVMAFVYSRKQLAAALTSPRYAPGVIGLTVGAVWLARVISLTTIFMPHYVLNEVFLEKRHLSRRFIASALVLNSLLYFEISRVHKFFGFALNEAWMDKALLAALAWFGVNAIQLAARTGLRATVNTTMFEILGIAGWCISMVYPTSIWHVVAYHIVFWTYYPLERMARTRGAGGAARFVGLHAAVFAAVLSMHPILNLPWHLSKATMWQAMLYTTFLHIMLTFATSKAHPDWIVRIFQPRVAARPMVSSPVPVLMK
jgi:hypothetical protein